MIELTTTQLDWLKDERNHRTILIDAEYFEDGVKNTFYCATSPYTGYDESVSPNVGPYIYPAIVKSIPSIVKSIYTPFAILGDIEILNYTTEADYTLTNEFDALLAYNWEANPINLYIGDRSWSRDLFIHIFSGIISKVTMPNSNTIRFSFLNLDFALNRPVQEDKYTETDFTDGIYTVPGNIYNLNTTLIGKYKPFGFGLCFNVEPYYIGEVETTGLSSTGATEYVNLFHVNHYPLDYTNPDAGSGILSDGFTTEMPHPIAPVPIPQVYGTRENGFKLTYEPFPTDSCTDKDVASDYYLSICGENFALENYEACASDDICQYANYFYLKNNYTGRVTTTVNIKEFDTTSSGSAEVNTIRAIRILVSLANLYYNRGIDGTGVTPIEFGVYNYTYDFPGGDFFPAIGSMQYLYQIQDNWNSPLVSYYTKNQETIQSILYKVTTPLSIYTYFDESNRLNAFKLVRPEEHPYHPNNKATTVSNHNTGWGRSDITVDDIPNPIFIHEDDVIENSLRLLDSLKPVKEVILSYGRNFTQQDENSLAQIYFDVSSSPVSFLQREVSREVFSYFTNPNSVASLSNDIGSNYTFVAEDVQQDTAINISRGLGTNSDVGRELVHRKALKGKKSYILELSVYNKEYNMDLGELIATDHPRVKSILRNVQNTSGYIYGIIIEMEYNPMTRISRIEVLV